MPDTLSPSMPGTLSPTAHTPQPALKLEANYSTGDPAARLDDHGCGFCLCVPCCVCCFVPKCHRACGVARELELTKIGSVGMTSYLSGRVAACANKVSDYQRSFQFYEDNAKKTLLGTMNEHAVSLSSLLRFHSTTNAFSRSPHYQRSLCGQIGSAGHPQRAKLVLSKESGILMDANNTIVKNWKWDRKAQHAGSPPTEPVVIQLNDALLLTYRDRSSISVTFAPCPGISVDFACGEQLRRSDTYLEHARRATKGPQRGKLLIDQATLTLQQRQKFIERESIEKRSKQRPRSIDLADERIKAIVSTLESTFDCYEGCRVTPAADGNRRERAHKQSLHEIPILPRTGAEVGQEPIQFGASVKESDSTASLKRLKDGETGEWLGSVEIHRMIAMENPVLRRGGPLTSASGRYSRELSVLGRGTRPSGEHLRLLPAHKLSSFLREACASDQLVVVACLRVDDCQSRAAEAVLEQIQLQLTAATKGVGAPQTAENDIRRKCCIVKCDLSESTLLTERYQIHAVPTFLVYACLLTDAGEESSAHSVTMRAPTPRFYDGRLVHATSLGGAPIRVVPATRNAHLSNQMDQLPRVLLVEKSAKQQVAIEKVLRKEAFQWDLASHGEQAVAYLTRFPRSLAGNRATSSSTSGSTDYGVVLLSDALDDFEVRSIDRFVRHRERTQAPETLVCVVVSSPLADVQLASGMCASCRRAHGRRISSESVGRKGVDAAVACPHCGILSADSTAPLLPAVLADIGQVFVHKHVKAATMHRLAEMWSALRRPSTGAASSRSSNRGGSGFVGLTVDSFFHEMERHLAAGMRGAFLPDHHTPAMALSANEIVLAPSIAGAPSCQSVPIPPVWIPWPKHVGRGARALCYVRVCKLSARFKLSGNCKQQPVGGNSEQHVVTTPKRESRSPCGRGHCSRIARYLSTVAMQGGTCTRGARVHETKGASKSAQVGLQEAKVHVPPIVQTLDKIVNPQ
ncbi:hypothetical protein PybrP1_005405 [[Pythium] brassicae (nom. inval.)]|nr:hypothetical protein PybrP1_005405 [[Pythium] brassicae (nom. inval.)]